MEDFGGTRQGNDNARTEQHVQVLGGVKSVDSPFPKNTHSSNETVTSHEASLLSLPVEILASIFISSLNLDLIYVCRHLWQSLASRYTKHLALLAFYNPGTAEPDEDGKYPVLDPPILGHGDYRVLKRLKIHEILGISPKDVRVQLQEKLFSSGWFTERHLQEIRRTLLRYSIEEMCSGQSLNVTTEDWKGIDDFLEKNKGVWDLFELRHRFHPTDRNGIAFEAEIGPYSAWIWRCISGTICEGLDKCGHCSEVTKPSPLDFAVPFAPDIDCLIEEVGNSNLRASELLDALAYHPSSFCANGPLRLIRPKQMFRKPVHTVMDREYGYRSKYGYRPMSPIQRKVDLAIVHRLAQTSGTYKDASSDPVGDHCLRLLLEIRSYNCRRRYFFDEGGSSSLEPRISRQALGMYYGFAVKSGNAAAFRRMQNFDTTWSQNNRSFESAKDMLGLLKDQLRRELSSQWLDRMRETGRRARRPPSLPVLLREADGGWVELIDEAAGVVESFKKKEAEAMQKKMEDRERSLQRKEDTEACTPFSGENNSAKRRKR